MQREVHWVMWDATLGFRASVGGTTRSGLDFFFPWVDCATNRRRETVQYWPIVTHARGRKPGHPSPRPPLGFEIAAVSLPAHRGVRVDL